MVFQLETLSHWWNYNKWMGVHMLMIITKNCLWDHVYVIYVYNIIDIVQFYILFSVNRLNSNKQNEKALV